MCSLIFFEKEKTMERKTNLFDFMCDHPIISMMMVTSICETLMIIFKPRSKKKVPGFEFNTVPNKEDMKSCGSTEEEPKEENVNG